MMMMGSWSVVSVLYNIRWVSGLVALRQLKEEEE